MINSTNEKQAAARCFQNQEKLFLTDVKVRRKLSLLLVHSRAESDSTRRSMEAPPFIAACVRSVI